VVALRARYVERPHRQLARMLPRVIGGSAGRHGRFRRKLSPSLTCFRVLSHSSVRLILDGTAVKVRLDRKATSISLLVVLGVRADGQKVVLAVKSMGESAEAWRSVLDDLVGRGLRRPEFVIVDGGSGLDAALAALWSDLPVQRCTVHYADFRIMPI
jgi:putative transposase